MAKVVDANLNVISPNEIIELLVERQRQYKTRDGLYELFNTYYRGQQGMKGKPSVMAANAQGRPLMRVGEQATKERVYSSQRLAPIIDDNQALLGRMPSVRVEPPDMSEAGVTKGELLTKYLVSTHELSSMDRQQAEMGWMMSCLGDGCYVLEVEPELRRVVWTVVDPSTAYPAFMSGYRRYDILDMVIHYYIDVYAAKARWGQSFGAETGDMVPVTIYLSRYQRSVVVGVEEPERVQHVEWDLKFCPAVWVFNKINGQMANSDIAQSLVQQDALDFTWAVFLDGIVQNTYPIIGVRNPLSVSGEPIQTGPGAPPVPLGPDGQITVTNSQGSLDSIQYGMAQLVSDINVASGTSQIRQEGTMHSSIPTGRAMHAAQGPQATRVELKQTELGAAIRAANSMTLKMQERAPLLGDHEFEIFGRYKGISFRQTMSGKDIDGWDRNTVFWEPVTGMNLQQKTAVAQEGMVAGLWDDIRAREIAGEDDPSGMRQRIAAQKLHEANLQAQMQQIMGGGQAPGGGGGAPPGGGGPPGGAPQGGSGPSGGPPPTMIARPPGMGADRATQGPQSQAGTGPKAVTLDTLKQALMLVGERLKGTVAAVGDLTKTGSATHIEVVISDHRDQPRVAPVLKAIDPNASVKIMPEDKWPKDAVRVA